jgi:hypothetical protein
MDEDKLAQPYDAMFERNIGHVAKGGREVEVWVEGLPEPKVGFVSGLDEEFVQLCLTKNASLSNIRIDMIVSMDETGVNMGGLIRGSRGTDESDRIDMISKKTNFFQKKASKILGAKT